MIPIDQLVGSSLSDVGVTRSQQQERDAAERTRAKAAHVAEQEAAEAEAQRLEHERRDPRTASLKRRV